jgi:hypothetical protein
MAGVAEPVASGFVAGPRSEPLVRHYGPPTPSDLTMDGRPSISQKIWLDDMSN